MILVEENKVRSEHTQILSECSSGFTDKDMIKATLVKTMVSPTQALAWAWLCSLRQKWKDGDRKQPSEILDWVIHKNQFHEVEILNHTKLPEDNTQDNNFIFSSHS